MAAYPTTPPEPMKDYSQLRADPGRHYVRCRNCHWMYYWDENDTSTGFTVFYCIRCNAPRDWVDVPMRWDEVPIGIDMDQITRPEGR